MLTPRLTPSLPSGPAHRPAHLDMRSYASKDLGSYAGPAITPVECSPWDVLIVWALIMVLCAAGGGAIFLLWSKITGAM